MYLQKNFAFGFEASQRQRQLIRSQRRKEFMRKRDVCPLISQALSVFWEMKYDQISLNIELIEIAVQNYRVQEIEEENEDEYDNFLQDLFYLINEQEKFTIPKHIKFYKNQSVLTASLVAIIATSIMPNELAYWINYMTEQDKQIMYLTISTTNCLWYMSWVNHKQLRQCLLTQFRHFRPASVALKQLICFKCLHPSKFSIGNVTITELLMMLFLDSFGNRAQVFEQHLQIAIFVISHEKQRKQEAIQIYRKALERNIHKLTQTWALYIERSYEKGQNIVDKEKFQEYKKMVNHKIEIE